jgi:peptidoglycan hydrolase-like protein with peptidoglycan-binding domain
VKLVQSFLGVTPDGVFGARTDIAVRNWQSRRGLLVDGIVGPAFAARAGFKYVAA